MITKASNVQAPVYGCQLCLTRGTTWVHLRQCTRCGHIGCCNSSQYKHAQQHYVLTGHPEIQSIEIGESWKFNFDTGEMTGGTD